MMPTAPPDETARTGRVAARAGEVPPLAASAVGAPGLSVVIPTRDRRERLFETLEALRREHTEHPIEGGFEVIVVDDGSRQASPAGSHPPALAMPLAEAIETLGLPFPIRCFHQAPQGPATARNLGVAQARAPRLLLLGDDTRPAPGTLAHHRPATAGEEVGIQGRIDWDPSREVTPLMDFLAPAGPQFYFVGLRDGSEVSWRSVLGSNLSIPTRWLREEPYDEGFDAAALEDTEAAVRWARRGWRVVWSERAVCWHHHHYDHLAGFLARQQRAGASVRRAMARHPWLVWALAVEPAIGGLLTVGRLVGSTALRAISQRGGRPNGARLRRTHQRARWDLACRVAYYRGIFGGPPT